MGKYERKNKSKAGSVFIELMKILHLDSKPLSFQANVCGEVLLALLCISVYGTSVCVHAANIFIVLGNILISLFSDREILPYLSTKTSVDASFCFWCLMLATVICPMIVYILDGFKIKGGKRK